jgi:molecular chaperone HtpG
MDDAEKLMPRYLRFVRGVIDSNDLPLNVSRELLQQNRLIEMIRSNAIKKVLGLLSDTANANKEKYATFWQEFGPVLKEGLVEDHANREAIAKLLLFASTASGNDKQEVSLEEYIGRMKEGQDKIYYLVADNYTTAKDSPLLEIFKKKGIEVLLLSDPIDHFITPDLTEFKGVKLQSVSKGEIDLGKLTDEQEKEDQQKTADESKDLLEHLKTTLSEKVKDVRTTNRLTSSPACLVIDEYGLDPSLKRLLEANGQKVPQDKQILEVNPQHAIIQKLKNEKDEARFTDWANVLFDQSVLSSGEMLSDPIAFVKRLNSLLEQL